MKKIRTFCLGIIMFLNLLSCSEGDNNSSSSNSGALKPKKITIRESGESPYSLYFEYNGNLITKITDNYGDTTTFLYDSKGRLTSYTYHYEGEPEVKYTATYETNLLKKIESSDGVDRILFYYNSNNQVFKTAWYESPNYLTTTLYEYDNNGNVTLEDDGYYIVKSIYDSRNNPFKNVFPQYGIPDGYEWFGSLVNNEIEVKRKNHNEGSVFKTIYTCEYEYNSENFPIKRIDKSISGSILETVTYEYY